MTNSHYDYVLVGAGLFNAVLAHQFIKKGKTVLVVERRKHIAGNCYDEDSYLDRVHKYGAHIFHTSNETVWKFVNRFTTFNGFINSPLANYNGEIYNLPFSMNTFSRMFNVSTPAMARNRIKCEIEAAGISEPSNLEEQAISMVGTTIYRKLIKGYTEKQWGRPCSKLSPDIIKRIPLRFTYDNNYFNDKYQGIPDIGYTKTIEKMFEGADILLETDFLNNREYFEGLGDRVFYSGCIDEYYGYRFGPLEYRGLKFVERTVPYDELQGNAVINFTDEKTRFTRTYQHIYFNPDMYEKCMRILEQLKAVALNKFTETWEYPVEWKQGDTPYYPINDAKNNALFDKYREIRNDKVMFVSRLGTYRYMDMDDCVEAALKVADGER